MFHIIGNTKNGSQRAEAMETVNTGFNGAYAKYSAN